jgi:hypothetical protein
MNHPELFGTYLCMTGGYAVAGMAACMQKNSMARYAGAVSLAVNFAAFFLIIYHANRLPIFGIFESVTTITLVLGSLHFTVVSTEKHPDRDFYAYQAMWIYLTIILLLICLAFSPMELNVDFYMYDDFRVIVFFHFRILASAVFIYAALISVTASYHGFPEHFHTARNYLLIGAAIFLISEFSGSLWCLNWLGDSWHWSRGFLKASGLFLAAMLACHIPPTWNLSKRLRGLIGCIPAAGCLWLLFLH